MDKYVSHYINSFHVGDNDFVLSRLNNHWVMFDGIYMPKIICVKHLHGKVTGLSAISCNLCETSRSSTSSHVEKSHACLS